MNKRGLVCIAAGLALVLAAGCLTGYNVVEERRAGENAEEALGLLRTVSIKPGELEIPEGLPQPFEVDPQVQMSEIEIDGRRYVGFLSIPSLELDLPVMSEWSYPNMKTAPCRYWGSVYLDNMVICAHNYVNHFGRLGNVSIGDPVIFTDVDGNVFNYTVSELIQLNPNQTLNMVKGLDWDLTLFTCTTSGRQRLTVRCVRAEESAT